MPLIRRFQELSQQLARRIFRGSHDTSGCARYRRVCFEPLERRDLLTGFIQFYPNSGFVTIQGDVGNDVSNVTYVNANQIEVTLTGVASEFFNVSDVNRILFLGEAGNDVFVNSTAIQCTAHGGVGHDRLTGGSNADLLTGGAGYDQLIGQAGDDRIDGGYGNDYINAGSQNDTVFAGAGDDFVTGGPGSDWLNGDDGADRIFGYYGNDRINGGSGDDFLSGQIGNDQIYGEAGADQLYGGDHNDRLIGGDDNDFVDGGNGDDMGSGGWGDDEVWGGAGHDRLFGYYGNDLLEGGVGDDLLRGQAGNDVLFGDVGVDQLFGGDGNDGLFGGGAASADILDGEVGADRLLVYGNDAIQGLTSEDAELVFVDVSAQWNDAEIRVMDAGFAQLHERTENTRLLQDSLGDQPLTFYQYSHLNGAAGVNALQWSSQTQCDFSGCHTEYTFHREIRILDWDENSSFYNDQFRQVLIHEIAHNWDGDWTIDDSWPVLHGMWSDFLAISDWRDTQPSNSSGYTQSLDGNWWYQSSSSFAENYGRTNPYEDFATVFESYFNPASGSVNSGLQPKLDLVDELLNRLM